MKNNFVEKSLKMPYSRMTGYFELEDRKIFCVYSDDGERYFDKKDEEFVKKSLQKLNEAKYIELPRAVVKESELVLGDTVITCSVLEDGRRIIKDTSLFNALKRSRKGEKRIEGYPAILGSKALVEILEDLYPNDKKIIFPFEVAQFNGTTGMWYDANAIPILCDLYMEAEHRGLIKSGQMHVLQQAKILLRSLAKVGITALIDEATNYQDIRGKDELQILLSKFISEELQRYSTQFPQDYFKELFKLYGLQYDPTTTKRPRYFSQFNRKYVYDMLPPQVWEQLDRINPIVYNPKKNRSDRKYHIHRNLSKEGLNWLQGHLQALIPIMTISDDIDHFKKNFDKAFSKKKEALEEMKDRYQGEK